MSSLLLVSDYLFIYYKRPLKQLKKTKWKFQLLQIFHSKITEEKKKHLGRHLVAVRCSEKHFESWKLKMD